MTHPPKHELLPKDFMNAAYHWDSLMRNDGNWAVITRRYAYAPAISEALRRCAQPAPSDGAAAIIGSPDSLKRGDAAHGDTAGVAALPEGVMSAEEVWKQLMDAYHGDILISPFNLVVYPKGKLPYVHILEQWRAQLSQAKGGWECALRKNPSPAGVPQDCGWPGCGCDPNVERVLSELQEHDLVLVPQHPTKEMLSAGDDAGRKYGYSWNIYRAMIAAAPKPGEKDHV